MTNHKMTIKTETVSPKLARKYLQRNIGNREIKPWVVKRYAEQMANGKWIAESQPIMFDRNGKMIDGQHRLNAIIKYGKPVDIAIIRNAEPKAAHVCDQGSKRTVSDLITIKTDGKGTANQTNLSATASIMLRGFQNNPSMYPDADRVSDFALENQEMIQGIIRSLKGTPYGKSFVMAAFANAAFHHPERIKEVLSWCHILKENFGFSSAKDPLNAFTKKFQKLENEKKQKKEVPGRRYYAATISAIMAKMDNKQVSLIKEADYCPFTNTSFKPSEED